MVEVGGMSWPKTGATYYHAELGLFRQRSFNQWVDVKSVLLVPKVQTKKTKIDFMIYNLLVVENYL